jgi:hypothetical protein
MAAILNDSLAGAMNSGHVRHMSRAQKAAILPISSAENKLQE